MPSTSLVYEDLETFPDDVFRREILGGELHVTPGPVPRHARVTDALARAVWAYSETAGGECYGSSVHIVLSAQNVVIPDVVYIAPDRLHTIGKKAVLGVPSLLVEVLSPSTARVDRVKKLGIYARLGVPEYWIVDPEANTIERCSDPSGDHYRDVEKFDGDMLAATLPGLALSFKQIFR